MIHQNDMQFQQKYIEIPVGNFNINIKKVTLKCTQKCKDLGGQKETKKDKVQELVNINIKYNYKLIEIKRIQHWNKGRK